MSGDTYISDDDYDYDEEEEEENDDNTTQPLNLNIEGQPEHFSTFPSNVITNGAQQLLSNIMTTMIDDAFNMHTAEPTNIVKWQSELTKFVSEMKPLDLERNELVKTIDCTREYISELRSKLKVFWSQRKILTTGLETKMLKVLEGFDVQLASYHGGTFNGTDIKKIMNNAKYIFDSFAKLLTRGKRIGCKLNDNQIVDKCNKYEHLFLLWDGAFSAARTNNPQKKDIDEFTYFINAAFECHKRIGCSITPKVHLMKAHCAWQMANLEGGLGDKGEDWVEQKHQDMAKLMRQYRNVKNPQ